jgi:hypothetical protein
LPIESSHLRNAIAHAFNGSNRELDFLSFEAAQIVIDGEDLGSRKIALQQAVPTLRWKYSQHKARADLVLVDDLESSPVRVRLASFSRPSHWSAVPIDQATQGLDILNNEGLYVATNADEEACAVVSPTVVGSGFEMFRVHIEPVDLPRGLEETLETFRLWSSARVCGLVSRHRQRHVLQALEAHGIGQITGHRWQESERALSVNPTQLEWERLEASAQWDSNYGVLLANAWANVERFGGDLEQQFVNITTKLHLVDQPEVAHCAWRMSGGFQGLTSRDVASVCRNYAGKLGSAMRGARLLRLFVERGRSVAAMEQACKQ